MKSFSAAVFKNYLTTFFGCMAGLPLIVAGSGMQLSPSWSHRVLVVGGLGTIGLGVVSKAFNVSGSSTPAPSTPEVPKVPEKV